MMDARNLARPFLVALLSLAALLCCTDAALAAPPPAPVIASPAQGTTTNDSEPVFAGSAEDELDPIVLNVYAGAVASGSPVETLQSLLPPLGGSWSLQAGSPLPDGEYTAVAEQTNQLAESSASAPVTFLIDTAAPAVSTDAVPSPTADATPTLEGSGGGAPGDEAVVTITVHHGGSVAGPVAAGPQEAALSGGHWSLKAPHLADGTYTVEATQRDQAGNVGEAAPVTFVVDTSAPAVSIDSVGSPTDDSSPTLRGHGGTATGDAESVTVTLRRGGEAVGSPVPVPLAGDGSWTYTTPTLEDGAYTAEVTQSDLAGNVGEAGPVAFTIDTTPPSLSIDQVASPSKDVTPTLEGGAGTAPGDEGSVAVTVHAGGSIAGATVASHSAPVSGGRWSWTVSTLPGGTYTVQATQRDEAGNTGEAKAVTFAIDTTPPSVSIEAVGSPGKNAAPTLEGTGGTAAGDAPSVSVAIHHGATVGGPLAAGPTAVALAGGGKWSLTAPHLADGTYTAQVSQQDEAGNGASASTTFTIDTTAPSVSISPISSPTRNQSPTLTGSAGTATGDAGSLRVTLHEGTLGGAVVGSPATVPVSEGGWSYKTPQLAEGTYAVQVTQSDLAGNVGEASSAFVVDTTPPALTIEAVATVSNDSTPTLEGAAGTASGDVPSVTVEIHAGSVGGALVGAAASVPVLAGGWSYDVPALGDGTYVALAVQKDAAGNVAKVSTAAFTIDTQAPAVTLDQPASNVARPAFGGTRGTAAGDLSPVTLTVYEGFPPKGKLVKKVVEGVGSKWSTGAIETPLESGRIYTVIAEQADDAGNVGRSEVVFTVQTEKSPTVTISTQGLVSRAGEWFSRPGPTIGGTAGTGPEDGGTITVYFIRDGVTVKTMTTQRSGAEWSLGAVAGLEEGGYLLVAEQSGPLQPGTGHLALTIDGQAPQPAVTVPANGGSVTSPTVQVVGTAGSAAGDSPTVTVQLYRGSTVSPPAVESVTLQRQGNAWSGSLEGVAPGTYTIQAEQSDDVGNVGLSAPATFTVSAVSPVASFQWIPAKPFAGETVSLVSTSTDPVNPLTGFAWDLAGSEAFAAGESIAHTTFATPGDHVVRLRVTDAAGASATVAETIAVARTPAVLMSPFPIVRIAGRQTAAGARIALLTVQAPLGATVSISCRGKGCPAKSVSQVVALSGKRRGKAGTVLIPFPRFERGLRAGVVLEIRVTKAGQIGKYTRFSVRLGKLPKRVDMCLSPAGVKPIVCPS